MFALCSPSFRFAIVAWLFASPPPAVELSVSGSPPSERTCACRSAATWLRSSAIRLKNCWWVVFSLASADSR
jgi:hypothetical protein